jgi:hypothetical protein
MVFGVFMLLGVIKGRQKPAVSLVKAMMEDGGWRSVTGFSIFNPPFSIFVL